MEETEISLANAFDKGFDTTRKRLADPDLTLNAGEVGRFLQITKELGRDEVSTIVATWIDPEPADELSRAE